MTPAERTAEARRALTSAAHGYYANGTHTYDQMHAAIDAYAAAVRAEAVAALTAERDAAKGVR